MNFLLVNDDGYNALGINILKKHLKPYGNIYVIAPNVEKSGSSHSFSYCGPFYLTKVCENEYTLNAFPVDCVRLSTVLDVKFDIVFSGINNGLNLGTDIIYSGTLGAAREALIQKIPSIAISTDRNSFEIVEKEIDDVLKLVFDNKLYSDEYILNINFPTSDFKKSVGYRVAKMGKKIFTTTFKKQNDYYESLFEKVEYDKDTETDVYLSLKGYTTIVPLKLNQTDEEKLETLKIKVGN